MLTFGEFILEKFDIPWIDELPIGTSKQNLYRYVNYIANRLGEELVGESSLGSGTYGTAFELKSGKVLKLTGDVREAKMAQWLKNRNTTYLISCYSIYEIKPGNIYALVMEKLDIHENNLNYSIIWDSILSYINRDPSVILEEDKNFIISKIEHDYDIDIEYEEIKKYIEDNWDSIYGITKEIIELDIIYPDIHTDNLGFDSNGTLIYFDVKEMNYKKKKRKDLSNIKLDVLDISAFFKEPINI